jgi:hypothetical protein
MKYKDRVTVLAERKQLDKQQDSWLETKSEREQRRKLKRKLAEFGIKISMIDRTWWISLSESQQSSVHREHMYNEYSSSKIESFKDFTLLMMEKYKPNASVYRENKLKLLI